MTETLLGKFSLKSIEAFSCTDAANLLAMVGFALKNAGRNVLLFLDGLDEFDGNKGDLIIYIRKRLIATNTKVCLSCRPDPPFTTALDGLASLVMHEFNAAAIKAFCLDYLGEALGASSQQRENFMQHWTQEITIRAEGVIFWANFAVREVFNSTSLFEDQASLSERLEAVPAELSELYARKLAKMKENDKRVAGLFLALVTSAEKSMTALPRYQAACLLGIHRHSPGPIDTNKLWTFCQRVRVVTGGLLEFTICYAGSRTLSQEKSRPDEVRIIHRTVDSFLEDVGWDELFKDSDESRSRHLVWLKVGGSLLAHLQADEGSGSGEVAEAGHLDLDVLVSPTRSTIRDTMGDITVLQDYVVRHVHSHASHFEHQSGRSSWSYLKRFSFAQLLIHIGTEFDFDKCARCTDVPGICDSGLTLAIAVAHGLIHCVEECLQAPSDPSAVLHHEAYTQAEQIKHSSELQFTATH